MEAPSPPALERACPQLPRLTQRPPPAAPHAPLQRLLRFVLIKILCGCSGVVGDLAQARDGVTCTAVLC